MFLKITQTLDNANKYVWQASMQFSTKFNRGVNRLYDACSITKQSLSNIWYMERNLIKNQNVIDVFFNVRYYQRCLEVRKIWREGVDNLFLKISEDWGGS